MFILTVFEQAGLKKRGDKIGRSYRFDFLWRGSDFSLSLGSLHCRVGNWAAFVRSRWGVASG